MDPLDYLFGLERFGIKFGLENIRTLCHALGSPQNGYPTILIGGTNGKGSVTAMVSAALGAAGFTVGQYTSPHLVRLEERFEIDGRPVATAGLRDVASAMRETAERLRASGALAAQPTFFEVTTAIAFELFRRAVVDVAVLEVGLGGRFDATNVVTPVASAIVSIDLDHERFLGATIPEIAYEKAGIVKPGIPIVLGDQKPEAVRVIEQACAERGARLVRAHGDIRAAVEMRADGRTILDLETPRARYGPVELALRGRHQIQNAIVAVRLLEEIGGAGLAAPAEAVAAGLSGVRWRGRLEIVDAGGGRRMLLDAAHNPAGAQALAAYLREVHPGGVPLVFGAMRDKDVAAMLAALLPCVTRLVVTRPSNPRATAVDDLAACARRVGAAAPIEAEADPAAALDRAWASAPLICVAGSIFLIGDVLAWLERRGTPA